MESRILHLAINGGSREAARAVRKRLLGIFWLGVVIFLVTVLVAYNAPTLEVGIGGMLVLISTLLPTYLWCKSRALGFPIYPIFTLMYSWTYAVPVLKGHPSVSLYSPDEQLYACFTVIVFLSVATFVWFKIVSRPKEVEGECLALEGNTAENFFLVAFALSTLFIIGTIGGWVYVIGDGAVSLARGLLLSLNTLGTFILSYRWGARSMSRAKSIIFVILLICFALSSTASLLIVGALSSLALVLIGFLLGRGRIPIAVITVALVSLIALHYGKSQMRAKYFFTGEMAVQPWDYPAWYAEWLRYSFDALMSGEEADDDDSKGSFVDRGSTMQLLLLAQKQTAEGVPFLYGETYWIIPRLLVPRFIDPEKPWSHEGTYLLNIHYGLQTREQTMTTTIGWGLLNEAYANFGMLGCVVIGALIGAGLGACTRWGMTAPILSARSLFLMLLLSLAIQTELSASVYLTALFQSTVSLVCVARLFMKREKIGVPTARPQSYGVIEGAKRKEAPAAV